MRRSSWTGTHTPGHVYTSMAGPPDRCNDYINPLDCGMETVIIIFGTGFRQEMVAGLASQFDLSREGGIRNLRLRLSVSPSPPMKKIGIPNRFIRADRMGGFSAVRGIRVRCITIAAGSVFIFCSACRLWRRSRHQPAFSVTNILFRLIRFNGPKQHRMTPSFVISNVFVFSSTSLSHQDPFHRAYQILVLGYRGPPSTIGGCSSTSTWAENSLDFGV
jgi:hypothetical protein